MDNFFILSQTPETVVYNKHMETRQNGIFVRGLKSLTYVLNRLDHR